MKTSAKQIFESIQKQPHSICVFDLDSTLFNVSPRTEKILHEFAVTHQQIDLLKIKIPLTDWGIFESLSREGYTIDTHEELHSKLKKEWKKKFFSNEYLHYDTPYPGAVFFVQKLNQLKYKIKYLTGRDVERMSLGTGIVLDKWGFPSLPEMIHLKPHKDMNDEYFKLDWLKDLASKNQQSKIFFFENEPVNINLVGKHMPDVQLIYLDTTHSRAEKVNVPHLEISQFQMDLE